MIKGQIARALKVEGKMKGMIRTIDLTEVKAEPLMQFNNNKLKPEDFYYSEEGYKVFTEIYHLKRGYCCKSGCRHCPYGFDKERGS